MYEDQTSAVCVGATLARTLPRFDLFTFELTFPRVLLPQLETHRGISRSGEDQGTYEQWAALSPDNRGGCDTWVDFSKNVESSRAVPTLVKLQQIRDGDFFVPTFRAERPGMGGGDALDPVTQSTLRARYIDSAHEAADTVADLAARGACKEQVNRLLEPYLWCRVVATGTREMWEHFTALRTHAAAQGEMATLARAVVRGVADSQPRGFGGGHLPYREWAAIAAAEVDDGNDRDERKRLLVAGRIGAISYGAHRATALNAIDCLRRATAMKERRHWSSFEHCAIPVWREGGGRGDARNFGYGSPWAQHRAVIGG